MHGDVVSHLGGLGVGAHQDADLGGQVGVGAVQVELDLVGLEAADTAHDDLLADDGLHAVGELLDGGAVDLDLGQGIGVGGAGVQGGGEDLLGVVEELLVLGHEVGLGVDLDEDADLAVAGVDDLGGDEAGGGGAALALGNALEALDANDLDGLLGVAVGLVEGLLDVEHAGAGLLAQRLDVSGGVVRHECLLVSQ